MVMEKDLFGETESSLEEGSSDEEQVPTAMEVGGHEREKQPDDSPSASSSGSSSSSSSGESEGEEMAVPPAETITDSQFPSTQDLFGGQSSSSSSSSGEEGESEQNENRQEEGVADSETKVATSDSDAGAEGGLKQVKDLFGDAGDLSSSDEESPSQALEGAQANRTEREEEEEREVPRIDVSIPRCVAQLGSEIYFIKLPNFLSIETRPFDPQLYEDETEDDAELLDEDGRTRLKLKVENTIRWRQAQNELGEDTKESNARIVRWSDGSMSLYLGSEIFDIYRQALQGEHSHLFVRQGTGLQGQAVFKHKLTFRPHSTDSHTHRKMTLSIADRFSKAQKIRVLPVVGKDPETQRIDKIKKEEQRLRESVRLESRRRRVRERFLKKDLTSSYLEGDEDLEENEESVSAIKSSMKARVRHGVYSESEEEDSGEERLLQAKKESGFGKKRQSDADAPQVRKKGRRVVSDDEDSDE